MRLTSICRAVQVCIVSLALVALVSSTPVDFNTTLLYDDDGSFPLQGRDDKPFLLRIMPLGASITFGLMSQDGNGYRKFLRDQLRYAGWEVNMVGSRKNGTMNDNDVEGWSGYVIDQVAEKAENTIPKQPNVILINAGTNDAVRGREDIAGLQPSKAGDRMNILLQRLFDAIPDTTIILSTLLPNEGVQANKNVGIINAQYRQLAAHRRKAGESIILAEMDDDFITTGMLVDGTHPTAEGYKKMAAVWWAAIQEAETESMLKKPKDTGNSDKSDTRCEKEYGSGNADSRGKTQTQRGSGWDNGNYKHNSENMGRIFHPEITKTKDGWHPGVNYAQLVNQGGAHREGALDELVWTKDGDGTYMYANNGNGKFGAAKKIDVKDGCLARGVRWGDVNNDGLDDFICISREGAMYVSINEGGNPPTFKSIGLVRAAPSGDLAQDNVKLGDIDGDGRIDYCLVKSNGDIQCWRNGGQREAPTSAYGGYWQDLGVVFTGKRMGDLTGVNLVDINGDFRSDWLWMDDTGKITTYINNRGTGKSLKPDWRRVGVTHAGIGVDGAKDRIRFGHVYPGRGVDYIYLESLKNNDMYNHYTHVWKNVGSGGTQLKGDGVYYCDWRGTGADDYIWVSPSGKGLLYGNIQDPPRWVPEGPEIFNIGRRRKTIHLADFDGDGKCDIWSIDRDTGKAEVWINHYNLDTETGFLTYKGVVNNGVNCKQGWGVGINDLGVRLADLDGDGRADYLCMEPNGRTDGWLNKGVNDFVSKGQVKRSQGYDRANHRWADVDGDGKADFLWVDKFNGDTKVWMNRGDIPTAGSSWKWELLDGPRYQGADRGANMYFPNLGGLGRADFHQVIPRTNKAYTWFNTCPGDGSADDGDITDPEFPEYCAPDQPPAEGDPPTTPPSGGNGDDAPSGYYENWPIDDPDRIKDMCDNVGDVDQSTWLEYDIGSWMIQTSAWYQKLTLDPNNDFNWDTSVPETFARYNATEKDAVYVWGCYNVRYSCDTDNISSIDLCKKGRYYRMMVLKSLENLANYFQIISKNMESAWTSMHWATAGMMDDYSRAGDSSGVDFGTDGGLALAAGLASTFSAFFLSNPLTAVSGALTMASAIFGALPSESADALKWVSFADLGEESNEIREAVIDSLDHFYNSSFVDAPPRDSNWVQTAASIPRILQSGAFADASKLSTGSPLIPSSNDLKPLIAAPMINILWRNDLVWVVKIDNSVLKMEGDAYHPCDETGDFKENVNTDDIKFCNDDGTAFFVYTHRESVSKFEKAKGIDKLSKYGITGHDVAKSAELVQSQYGKYLPKVDKSSYFSWIPDNDDSGNVPNWQMMRWNLPVCDLTQVDKFIGPECTKKTMINGWVQCFHYLVLNTCNSLKDWPDDYECTDMSYCSYSK